MNLRYCLLKNFINMFFLQTLHGDAILNHTSIVVRDKTVGQTPNPEMGRCMMV
jgi:hypothetical protein